MTRSVLTALAIVFACPPLLMMPGAHAAAGIAGLFAGAGIVLAVFP